MDHAFLTRTTKQRSTFERKYLERFGNGGDKRIGLPGLSPQLVDKHREMEQANTKLDDARGKFENWKTMLARKRREVDEQQDELAEQKKSLDVFTQHHIMELDKTKRREREEIAKAREIEKELKSLTEREETLRIRTDTLARELKELQPCADYLQAVVESCQAFDSIESILYRHESLSNAKQEYLELYETLMATFGTEEEQLALELEVKKSHLIDSTMKFNEKISTINQTKKINEYRNASLMKAVQRIVDKNTELCTVRSSVRTIYARALSQSSGPAAETQKKGSVTEDSMLEYVKNRFLDLRDILRDSAQSPATVSPEPATPSSPGAPRRIAPQ
jgi:DNA repair exonuclease SbcCD ATPase subunit